MLFVIGVCRLLGWLPLLLTFTIYPLFSSVPLLFSSMLYYSILFYSVLFYSRLGGCLWNVSVCLLSVCVDCLGGCLFIAYIRYTSSLLFCSFAFLLYSLLFYAILFYFRVGGCLWNVSVCVCRCVWVAWVAVFIAYIHYISSLLFCSACWLTLPTQ